MPARRKPEGPRSNQRRWLSIGPSVERHWLGGRGSAFEAIGRRPRPYGGMVRAGRAADPMGTRVRCPSDRLCRSEGAVVRAGVRGPGVCVRLTGGRQLSGARVLARVNATTSALGRGPRAGSDCRNGGPGRSGCPQPMSQRSTTVLRDAIASGNRLASDRVEPTIRVLPPSPVVRRARLWSSTAAACGADCWPLVERWPLAARATGRTVQSLRSVVTGTIDSAAGGPATGWQSGPPRRLIGAGDRWVPAIDPGAPDRSAAPMDSAPRSVRHPDRSGTPIGPAPRSVRHPDRSRTPIRPAPPIAVAATIAVASPQLLGRSIRSAGFAIGRLRGCRGS